MCKNNLNNSYINTSTLTKCVSLMVSLRKDFKDFLFKEEDKTPLYAKFLNVYPSSQGTQVPHCLRVAFYLSYALNRADFQGVLYTSRV